MKLAFEDFLKNNYYNSYFIEFDLIQYFEDTEKAQQAFDKILAIYQKVKLDKLSEAQLEEEFIKPVLQNLGYSLAYQVNKKVFGKNYKPEFALFADENTKNVHYEALDRASNEDILALCESKASEVKLDNKKNTEQNPHFQLIRYLNDLKINFGFLTNGKFWRFYDVRKQREDKIFYEINLAIILEKKYFEAFQYFYYLFRKEYLVNLLGKNKQNPQGNFLEISQSYILQVENDLKELIYGQDSIIELIGQRLFNKYEDQYTLSEIYANSLFFGFRMLFIAYFENKFDELLFKKHPVYKFYALQAIWEKIENNIYPPQEYNAWNDLKELFNYLNEGNLDLSIPLLNGGLFAPQKAPLLGAIRILNNEDLHKILSLLLLHNGNTKAKRDFKTVSVTHIGNIYEGLLESEFRQAFEGMYYVEYEEKTNLKEGYFDKYDYENNLKKNKKIKVLREKFYHTQEIYLSNQSNQRKSTASYYTPSDISGFMTKSTIEAQLKEKESILDLRLIDNACGSGHFLVESLKVLTENAIERILQGSDLKLQNTLTEEKKSIEAEIQNLGNLEIDLDEFVLLKRILLKKVIFGLDLNDFAIELSRLSLWLDTFILGTPLSFIEHHIKQGNALIGFTKQALFVELEKYKQDLFSNKLKEKIKALIHKLGVLSNLKDNTAEEIQKSKKIFDELQPDLAQLNLSLNFFLYQRFVPIIFKDDKPQMREEQKVLRTALDNFEKEIFEKQHQSLIEKIEKTAQKFSFFNYEIEFAEVFENGSKGYDIVINNPPWDKTKFDDTDFFSMWRSDYRTMKQSEKKQTRETVLAYKGIHEEYENKRNLIVFSNEYYKTFFPYNAGVGDSNLFRFFIEHNLRLLKENGSFTCVAPSAWIYEDGSLNIRKHIFQHYQLHYFYQFENRKGIFPRVHRSYKFAIFKITKTKDKLENNQEKLPVRFMKTDTQILYQNKGQDEILYYPYSDIETLSPKHWALFEVKSEKDLEILRKVYQKFPTLDPKYLNFRNEIYLTQDRDIFKEFIDFRRELDMTQDRDIFSETPDDIILYEGKMIHQFRNDWEMPQYWVNTKSFKQRMITKEMNRFFREIYAQIPQKNGNGKKATQKQKVLAYLGIQEEDIKNLILLDKNYPRLVFRDIASNTNIRSIISAIIPPETTYGNTLQGHIPKKYLLNGKNITIEVIPMQRILFLQSLLNSMVVDYIIRFIIDLHVNKTYLMRLPIPQPNDNELQQHKLYQQLIINALKLNLANNPNLKSSLQDLQNLLDIQDTDLPKTDKEKFFVQIENDCLLAKLYGLSLEDLKHLTSADYFKVLHEQRPEYVPILVESYEDML